MKEPAEPGMEHFKIGSDVYLAPNPLMNMQNR
jgi:hypothetical protein